MPALAYRPRLPKPEDPEITRLFSEAIAEGHGTATAATIAGISHSTANYWISQGTEELAEHEEHPDQELGSHVAFALATKSAVASFVSENLGIVRESRTGPKAWLPAMTLLERRQPQDFARRFEAKVESTVTSHVTFSVEALPVARQRALAELALKTLPPAPDEAQDVVEGEVVQHSEVPSTGLEGEYIGPTVPVPGDVGGDTLDADAD